MARGIGQSGWTRRAVVWLAVLALAFKVAVPSGFMVAPHAGHRIAIVLCSGHGFAQAEFDLTSGQIVEHGLLPTPANSDDGKSKHAQVCPFAATATAAAAPSLASLAASRDAFVSADTRPLHLRPHLAPTGPPLPARGPPLTA